MPGQIGPRGIYDYTSDNGSVFPVSMTAALANAGGFPVSSATAATYPRKWRMRHVNVKDAAGKSGRLPVSSASAALFINGGSVTIGTDACTVMGRIGEKRPHG